MIAGSAGHNGTALFFGGIESNTCFLKGGFVDVQMLEIDKSFDDSGTRRTIFSRTSARITSGSVCMIMGKSGVGKSSLLNLISGIDLPDQGEIRVGDRCINTMTDTNRTLFRRRHIGFIFQFFNLIPVLTVLENVTLIAELDKTSRKTCRNRAQALLEQVGLWDRRFDFPETLSGGEQQRVAIVRALVNNPDLVLADEPTGNLDQETGKTIMEMISDLVRKQNKTLIMVTHSPDAAVWADQIFTVADRTLTPLKQVHSGETHG
jgi:putative ABC transport system ATP-binding protein